MAYAERVITERLLDYGDGAPWALAPKALRDAAEAAGKATSDNMNAASALEDATIGIPMAEAAWEAAGRAAARAGEPLPNHDGPDAAKFTLQNAEQDAHIAERRLSSAITTLTGALTDQETRDTWREAIEARIAADQAKLAKVGAGIADQCAQVSGDLAMTRFLGEYGQHLLPPNVGTPDPSGALRRLSTLKPWTAPQPAGEARMQEPTAPDTRPAVFIRNDLGGVHNVHAKDVDALIEQPGWRLATTAEIEHWHKRQGIPVPA